MLVKNPREKDFMDLQMEVKGCSTLIGSFDKLVEVEMLEGENQYDAEELGKQDARRA